MSSTEKVVKGATKIKLAPPKAKYIEPILALTRRGESGVAEIFETLQLRLKDSTWTISFKALIVTHLMIREGEPNVTLAYLSQKPRKLVSMATYSEVQTQGRNILNYSTFLAERAKAYLKAKVDYVENGQGRLKRLSVDKGLLRETESVQEQIQALIKCDFLTTEPENEITLTAFRLIVMDLLALFQVMNEGTINVLEHYFEMSRPDAERALQLYKSFARLTEAVVRFLSVARQYEAYTRVEIPKIKHAPTSLANSLEEYLNDMDFETNRTQYLAQQDAKNGGKLNTKSSKGALKGASSASKPPESSLQKPRPISKGPAPDLIDFFASIEEKQQPLAQDPNQYQSQQAMYTSAMPNYGPQQTGFVNPNSILPQHQQQTMQGSFSSTNTGNPFQAFQQPQTSFQQPQLQVQATSAGFGPFAGQPQQVFPQQQQQQQVFGNGHNNGAPVGAYQQQPQQQQQFPSPTGNLTGSPTTTNPFRQSMMPTGQPNSNSFGAISTPPLPPQPTGSNPFARAPSSYSSATIPPQQHASSALFSATTVGSPASTLVPQATGTNPFARNPSPNFQAQQQQASPVVASPTGSTNPFKNSAFINQQTGQGWQSAPQATMGGLEQLDTIPVFPRPVGQMPMPMPQQQQQPQQHQQQWG